MVKKIEDVMQNAIKTIGVVLVLGVFSLIIAILILWGIVSCSGMADGSCYFLTIYLFGIPFFVLLIIGDILMRLINKRLKALPDNQQLVDGRKKIRVMYIVAEILLVSPIITFLLGVLIKSFFH